MENCCTWCGLAKKQEYRQQEKELAPSEFEVQVYFVWRLWKVRKVRIGKNMLPLPGQSAGHFCLERRCFKQLLPRNDFSIPSLILSNWALDLFKSLIVDLNNKGLRLTHNSVTDLMLIWKYHFVVNLNYSILWWMMATNFTFTSDVTIYGINFLKPLIDSYYETNNKNANAFRKTF